MARGHVDISERRLRPIYDALDNGNNRKALQEADKVLKKQKDCVCAKALRALCLLRMNRRDESVAQVKEVHGLCPTEESTLQAMAICYREMNDLEAIADLYENANRMLPDSEEILSALFMAHVRVHNYKKQQQTAMKLHKLQPTKNPYYFWAVMSIVMQAQAADKSLAKTMYLPLAERMTEKYAKDSRIEAEAEVQLYLMVLEQMEKHDAALELVNGPLGERLQTQPEFCEVKRAELHTKLEHWQTANSMYKKLLLLNPDQWLFYDKYLETVFHLIDSNYTPPPADETNDSNGTTECDTQKDNSLDKVTDISSETTENQTETEHSEKEKETEKESETIDCEKENETKEGEDKEGDDKKEKSTDWSKKEAKERAEIEREARVVDYTVGMVYDFIKKQIDRVSEGSRSMRGPHLAQLELMRHLLERNKGEEKSIDIGDFAELLKQYYRRFGDKNCCHWDMQPYLVTLDTDMQKQIWRELLEEFFPSSAEICFPSDLKEMQKHLTLCTIQRLIGCHGDMTTEEKIEFTKELAARYRHGLQYGKELLKTDQQFSDNYLILTAFIFNDLWEETGEQKYVWQAIIYLERLLLNSPSNFQAKLLLIKFYCYLGAFGPCPTLYDSMEIKHIENDSLGYIVTNHMKRLGHISSAFNLCDTILKFFCHNHKETSEYLVQSYKYGTFTKVIEFVNFRDKLKNSLQFASARVEKIILDITMETVNYQGVVHALSHMPVDPQQEPRFEELSDNRDMEVISCWDPAARLLSKEDEQYSYREEVAWLKIRDLVIRSTAQSVILSQDVVRDTHIHNGNGDQDKKVAQRELLSELKTKLQQQLAEANIFAALKQYPLVGPYRTRLSYYLSLGLGELHCQVCDLVCTVHAAVDNTLSEEEAASSVKEISTSLTQRFAEIVESHCGQVIIEENSIMKFRDDVLEILVVITEFIGEAVILLGACHTLMKPLKALFNKTGKKKKGGAGETSRASLADMYKSLVDFMEKQTWSVQQAFKQLDDTVLAMSVDKLSISDLNNQHTEEEETMAQIEASVKARVVQSYRISATEMLTFLQNKLHFLESIKR